MRLDRIAFYIIMLITIGEVTILSLQARQEVLVTFSADWMESPMEEDETREIEDGDDLFFLSAPHGPSGNLNSSRAHGQGDDNLPEPLRIISVPPPKA